MPPLTRYVVQDTTTKRYLNFAGERNIWMSEPSHAHKFLSAKTAHNIMAEFRIPNSYVVIPFNPEA
jgi:hypothetical protein